MAHCRGKWQKSNANETIKVNVGANTTGAVRISAIVFHQDTLFPTTALGLRITQNALPSPCQASWVGTGIHVGAAVNTQTLSVVSDPGCPWGAARSGAGSFVTWTTGSSGTGNGTVGIRVERNPSVLPRTEVLLLVAQLYQGLHSFAECLRDQFRRGGFPSDDERGDGGAVGSLKISGSSPPVRIFEGTGRSAHAGWSSPVSLSARQPS
ncbi:MAG: hypothetical protein KIT83_01840 [Bryobacterales bacterium]|nr:hypothetical protein [Bryobacterales bacterium]